MTASPDVLTNIVSGVNTFSFLVIIYALVLGDVRSGEISQRSSAISCAGLVSRSWVGVCSADPSWSASGFLTLCGSFRNLTIRQKRDSDDEYDSFCGNHRGDE